MRSFYAAILIFTFLGCTSADKPLIDESKKPKTLHGFSCTGGDQSQYFVRGTGKDVTYSFNPPETAETEVVEKMRFRNDKSTIIEFPSRIGGIRVVFKKEVCVGIQTDEINTFTCEVTFDRKRFRGCGEFH